METMQQQQWEKLVTWLKTNALSISLVIIIGGGGSLTWHWYSSAQFSARAADSLHFEQLKRLSGSAEWQQAEQILQRLQQSSSTKYGIVASFYYAREAYHAGRAGAAMQQLQWIIDHSDDVIDLQLAADRLARLLLDQNKPDEAIALVQNVIGRVTNPSALGTLNMIIGDSQLFKKQYASAIDFYNTAKKNLPEQSPLKELLDMKIAAAQSL